METIDLTFLSQDAVTTAKRLIGWRLYVQEADGNLTGGVITETEAYTAKDAASHSFNGRTKRNNVMFGPAGRIYVYFTYGMHWCANIVTGPDGEGEAVLLRTLQPDQGLEFIRKRRPNANLASLTNGPAKLCQALAITGEDNGSELNKSRFLLLPPKPGQYHVTATDRIGISRNVHAKWRFIMR